MQPFDIFDEPNGLPAVRFINKIAQRSALSCPCRDAARDCQSDMVVDEFLDHIAGNSSAKMEKTVCKARDRDRNQRRLLLPSLAYESVGILFV